MSEEPEFDSIEDSDTCVDCNQTFHDGEDQPCV